jgi:hypothetical protein
VNHPITGLPFDYERCCATCSHFSDKTRTLRGDKFRTIKCALDPQLRNLGNDKSTAWWALPGCTEHTGVGAGSGRLPAPTRRRR